jgi:hypothetical protein
MNLDTVNSYKESVHFGSKFFNIIQLKNFGDQKLTPAPIFGTEIKENEVCRILLISPLK